MRKDKKQNDLNLLNELIKEAEFVAKCNYECERDYNIYVLLVELRKLLMDDMAKG